MRQLCHVAVNKTHVIWIHKGENTSHLQGKESCCCGEETQPGIWPPVFSREGDHEEGTCVSKTEAKRGYHCQLQIHQGLNTQKGEKLLKPEDSAGTRTSGLKRAVNNCRRKCPTAPRYSFDTVITEASLEEPAHEGGCEILHP